MDIKISMNVIDELTTKAAKITKASDQKGNNYFAKIIRTEQAQDLGYIECIYFNKQIFGDLEEFIFKQNLLQIKTDVSYEQMMALITEPYEINLQKYLKQYKVQQKQAKNIFSQIVKAIYSIVMNGYWHRNVRVEHFVKVKNVWKLQSLVLNEDYSSCDGKYNEYLWNPKYEPPQFIQNKNNYTEQEYNQMLVWNLGCILLQLLVVNHKLSAKQVTDKFKGDMFTMQAVGIQSKIAANYSVDIRELLGKMLHHNPLKRMKLDAVFEDPFISPEVSKHALQNKKVIPHSKIMTGLSSIKSSKLNFQSSQALVQIEKTIKENEKIEKKRLQESKIGLDDQQDFQMGLQQFSIQIPKKQLGMKKAAELQNINELMNDKNHPVRKALQLYKSYYDQSQLLILSSTQISKLDFKMFKTEPQIREIKFLNKYAITFVSLINLNALAEGFNQNKNILDIDGDLFINFQDSREYGAFKTFINFKRSQRAQLLQQIRKDFMMSKNKILTQKDAKVKDLLGRDYKKTNFQDIKAAYRTIVKFAYDAISQQYNRMKKTDSAVSLSKIAMYVTYALTIDKLYIKQDIPDNFKFYFEWLKKPACNYVPLNEFLKYIENAQKDMLIENSRFILKKYYNL